MPQTRGVETNTGLDEVRPVHYEVGGDDPGRISGVIHLTTRGTTQHTSQNCESSVICFVRHRDLGEEILQLLACSIVKFILEGTFQEIVPANTNYEVLLSYLLIVQMNIVLNAINRLHSDRIDDY
ncbi:hypothetical protein EVAR_17725_1 [Eumeta japonica]|uniref:Uncharacterized protein n=1 Tax=Eumeta variegata TaxID=151549 RepID=A0A4C1TT89_EUMVA|nr:hypothetical protein EVAR_17725_1 [Eumeta japonica]